MQDHPIVAILAHVLAVSVTFLVAVFDTPESFVQSLRRDRGDYPGSLVSLDYRAMQGLRDIDCLRLMELDSEESFTACLGVIALAAKEVEALSPGQSAPFLRAAEQLKLAAMETCREAWRFASDQSVIPPTPSCFLVSNYLAQRS